MKSLVFILSCLFSIGVFAQETEEAAEEFIPINIEGKDAFMSTKTGEYTYREHAKTDPTQLKTTASGVVYTDISSHTVKKGETLSAIAKKNGVSVSEIKKHNKVTSSNLKIGSSVKIVKKQLIKSSSPVRGTSGDERIIARLRPGESPGALAPPPPMDVIEKKLVKTEKTREKPLKPKYKAKKDIKNPILGLGEDTEEVEEVVEVPVKETKKERLKRLQAEMKALEAELEETEVIEVAKKEKVIVKSEPTEQNMPGLISELSKKDTKKDTKVEAKAHDSHDGHDHSKHAKEEESIKEEVELKVEEVKVENNTPEVNEAVKALDVEDVMEVVEENAEVKEAEESLAKKAARVLSQVKKTNKEVKAKEKVEAAKEVLEEAVEESKEEYFYTVVKGNSLWSIAQKHKMTVAELKKLNNLKSNNLDIGQKLKVNAKPKK